MEDKQAQALLTDAKNSHEHALVHSHIINALTSVSDTLIADEKPHIFKQNPIQYLRRMISARLKPDVNDAQLLQALHPTPAVGGSPSQSALKFIRDNEDYDRGWYAGACGHISRDNSEFSVAIRSALIEQDTLNLFAGAGIVSGSTPDTEWQELDSKLATVLSVLNHKMHQPSSE